MKQVSAGGVVYRPPAYGGTEVALVKRRTQGPLAATEGIVDEARRPKRPRPRGA